MSADRLAEIRARWESLRGGISGDGTRLWYWCCRAEYEVGAEDNRHHEDCFLFGHESMDDDVGWLCAEVERLREALRKIAHDASVSVPQGQWPVHHYADELRRCIGIAAHALAGEIAP